MGVDSEGFQRPREARNAIAPLINGIVTAVANLSFLDSCSSHLKLANKETNYQENLIVCCPRENSCSSGAVTPRAFRTAERPPPSTPNLGSPVRLMREDSIANIRYRSRETSPSSSVSLCQPIHSSRHEIAPH
ncbi:hypothetical protein Y032_0023g853 [Ancylostoma ceylanicum]|uniref:Uncharacterized protein n=1 Tax=Ancylostoma ceylanicum TaxID=53326 RepID=A0A016UZ91_9BILA|nr:hypothetical protein Y032_0023g853 [Ancylostoma ceylanicum]